MNKLNRSILCVWLPNWPIQRLVVASSELKKTQIVLYRNQPGRGQIVTAVSPAAELSGARVGMPLSEAKSLVGRSRRFADYHVFQHNPSADLRTLQELAMQCQRFSPVVGLESLTAAGAESSVGKRVRQQSRSEPSAILLNIDGLTHLFGGDEGLRTQLHRYFESLGYLIATAIAGTIGKAWGMARFAHETDLPVESKLDESAVFDALPIEALRLQIDTVDTLRQLGIKRIGQLRALPRAGLRSRFGDELTWRLDQADGLIDEVVDAIYPPADYEVEKFLDYPVTDRETIEVILTRLTTRLCQQMRSSGRGGLVWKFGLNGAHADSVSWDVKLFRPAASADLVMPLVKMQMESLFRERRKHQRGKRKRQQLQFQAQEFTVSVRNCVLLAERQRKLFDENPRLDKQAQAQLINRLSSRLGAEHVVRPVLQSGAQAEDSYFFEPLVGQTKTRRKRYSRRRSDAISPLQRPLILHSQPIPVEAFALDGTRHRSSGIPGVFVCGDSRHRVLRRWGPERIETAWWRGPTVRRDYWRVETAERRWWWVYRDLQKRRWFLHGEF